MLFDVKFLRRLSESYILNTSRLFGMGTCLSELQTINGGLR